MTNHVSFPQRSAFAQTKEKFGGIDIVCNNAGIGNEDKWRLMLDINLVC
jgi:NAD(P)-dependent dehydrogenase (short-subunit alcohol dehydrogenase family)